MGKRISISNSLKKILVIIGVVAGIYGFVQHIDSRIEYAVNDEQFIEKIASRVRPFVLFDENETIHVDGGAMQYLEKIEVKQVVKNKKYNKGLNIIITPKSHLAYAPVLEITTLSEYYVTCKRGSRHQWIYELILTRFVSGPSDEKEPTHFRLEIIK